MATIYSLYTQFGKCVGIGSSLAWARKMAVKQANFFGCEVEINTPDAWLATTAPVQYLDEFAIAAYREGVAGCLMAASGASVSLEGARELLAQGGRIACYPINLTDVAKRQTRWLKGRP